LDEYLLTDEGRQLTDKGDARIGQHLRIAPDIDGLNSGRSKLRDGLSEYPVMMVRRLLKSVPRPAAASRIASISAPAATGPRASGGQNIADYLPFPDDAIRAPRR